MKRPVAILGALLALQILLAAGLAAEGAQKRRGTARSALFSFDPKAVNRVIVEGPKGARVELVRSGDGWNVASAGGFPAEPGKVDGLLTRLVGLRHGAPVATSAGALLRFKVADSDFERRITLEANGKQLASAVFGTTEALRSVHARAAGAKGVELVDFSTWDAPTTSDEWLDRTALHIPRDEIDAVEVGGVTVERAPPPASAAAPASSSAPHLESLVTWRATGLPPGANVDPKAADALVAAVADLSFTGLAGPEPAGGFGLDHPQLVVSVRRKGGAKAEYRLAKAATGSDWILATSTRPEKFRIAAYLAEELKKDADPGTLSGHPPSPPPASTATPAAPAPAAATPSAKNHKAHLGRAAQATHAAQAAAKR